jgi:hypothetical protein
MKHVPFDDTQILPTIRIGIALRRLLFGQISRLLIFWQNKEGVPAALLNNHKLVIWGLVYVAPYVIVDQ